MRSKYSRNFIITSLLFFCIPFLNAQTPVIDSLLKSLAAAGDSPAKVKLMNELALEFEFDDTTKALTYALDANSLAEKIKDTKGLARSYTALGFFEEDKGNYEKARGFYLKSLHASESITDTKAMAGSYNNIASMYLYQGNTGTALNYYQRALQIFVDAKDVQGMAKVYGNVGMVYQEYGDNKRAIESHQKAYDLFDQLSKKDPKNPTNLKGMANALNNMGNTYKELGNYSTALEKHLKALKIRETLGDKVGMGDSYGNIGTIYLEQRNYILAEEAYKKNLEICESLSDKSGIGDCYNYLGCVYSKQGKIELALSYFFKAKALYEEIGNGTVKARVYGNIGTMYVDKNENDKALDYLQKALKIQEELADKPTMVISLNQIGRVFLNEKKYKEAIVYLERSIAVCKETGSREELASAYEYMGAAYSGMHDFSKAYQYHILYADTRDSLLNKENNKQIIEMQTRYDSEKKEQEIQLLNKDKTLQSLEIGQQKSFRKTLFVIIGMIVFIILVLLVLGTVLLRAYQNKKKNNELLSQQKQEINHQKELLEDKNKDITDSINYAKRIQRAIITSDNYLKQHLPEHFVFYRPKDIVSGDFYWCVQVDERVIVATADCTGHGVPGAFMSVIGASLLNEIIIERKITRPDLVLNLLREGVIKALNPEGSEEEAKDGMDIVLCKFNFKTLMMESAAANNPVWILKQNEDLIELKPDKFPVGKQLGDVQPFALQSIQLEKGDTVYTFTDGYADQFGGDKGKKFRYKPMKEIFVKNKNLSLDEQKNILGKAMNEWQGTLEQIDDILVIGVRV